MAAKIEEYGMIGNTQTVALVSSSGSIDWMCAPRFDSDACFTSLIGYDEHGRWALQPAAPLREKKRRYRGDTLILETDFICDGGAVRIIDFMPPSQERCDIFRIIEGLEGSVPLEMILNVRFGHGANTPLITLQKDGVSFVAGPDAAYLRVPAKLQVAKDQAVCTFTVKKGERLPLQLTWFPSHGNVPSALDAEAKLAETEHFWLDWSGRCTYEGRWRGAVMRSLLTLKALTYAPTGAVVAAPTTSLPEEIGGVRNWDYRFCWLRDAALSLHALVVGGYTDEARAFRDWVIRTTAGHPNEIQIMYNLDGVRRLTEYELDWLPGYESSRPVRIGNAASEQIQHDIYGEVMSSIYLSRKRGMAAAQNSWPILQSVMEHVERVWQHPDDGIWETRGGRRQFTYSKVMLWVAVNSTIKMIEELGDGGSDGVAMLPHLRALRERIHEEVCARGFNRQLGAFTQYFGGDTLDASTLLIPHTGFLPANDHRMLGTVRAIEKHLLRDGFVLRYGTEHQVDGLPGSEGAFLACSFWLADNYAFAGRLAEAEELFERLLSLQNDLGLLSEEYEPSLRRLIGNFPQAFTHLALIYTANLIEEHAASRKAKTPWPAGPEVTAH